MLLSFRIEVHFFPLKKKIGMLSNNSFVSLQEIEESESLILISALTSSKVHLKMDETSEELNVDDSPSSADDVTYSTG